MPRINEFTPLLVAEDDGDVFRAPRSRRRSVWQYVLAGALSLGVLSLFQQQRSSPPIDIADVAVSFNEDDATFLSSLETFKDTSVDPCVDFYQYACGGWLQRHEIPLDRPAIDSSFYVVSESNKDTIQRIFDQNPPQIGPLYHSCLNDQEVDVDAVAFVAHIIDSVHQANSTLALMEVAGELDQSLGISTFFSLSVGADPLDPRTNVLQLAQGGLTLPSREYYLEEAKVDAYATLFVDYVTKLFAVGDLDRHNVSEYAGAVLETETKLAEISLPNAALRNPWTTSTAYPFAEIAQRFPFVMAYLNGIYKQEPFPMLQAIVATPSFFEAQDELLKDENLLPQLKNYLSFHLIDSFGAILGEYFRRASHEFHGKIQGAGALLPRDQFCVRLTTAFLGDELGEYYMKDVFGPDAKAAAQALVAEIEESLKALLMTESWLDKVTYEAALAKLDKVKNYIGGPDVVEPLPFELQANAFFSNVKSLMQLSAAGTIQAIDQPVNEQAWDMFPSTVNAYYDPSANKMVFPAAILQPPFYSAEHFPAAANFARIGMVMGHELSHGFDDQGRNYDGNGALRSWWTPSVSAEFREKTQCLAAQYSTFPVVSIEDGHVLGTVNGNLTLGENIADNGGIHLAYEAYHLWKSAFALPPVVPPTKVPAETPSPPVEVPEQTPQPADITPEPVVPIPDEPVPEPTETGPGDQIPVVTLPPPVLPVPDAETPAPPQTEPSGEIPVATPSPPVVVPEPQPADIGPGEVIPEETSPAPTTTEPVVTPPQPPTAPTPPAVPDVPTPPEIQTPAPTPEPSDATPGKTKHKHKKEKEEPNEEEPSERQKHHKSGESEKDRRSDESESKEDDDTSHDHQHSTDKHGDQKDEDPQEEKSHHSKHGDKKHGAKDDEDKSSKREHSKTQDDGNDDKHDKPHRHEDESEGEEEESKKHKKHGEDRDDKHESATHRDKGHRHEGEDSERDESEGKHRHETSEGEGRDRQEHREHESKHERREERHRHDEEEDIKRHEGKHYGHEEPERENGHHANHDHRRDEDDEERGRHERHEDKTEHREERKEREEEEKHRRENRKHRHHSEEDYDEDHESERHDNHHRHDHEEREGRWEECGECEREKHKRHHSHKHKEDWDEEYEHHGCGEEDEGCGSKRHKLILYPFSGGDAKMHSMVEKLARAIAQPSDPVADDRLFFTAFAQNWCEKRTPAYAELLRTIDPHSPGKWRVNGPLMNYDKFAEVFSCPVGTPMNPEKKCVIW